MKSLAIMTAALAIAATTFCTHAQADDAKSRINTVKRDTSFIYAEATMTHPDSAIHGAKAILEMQVGEWVRQQFPNEEISLCLAKAKEHTTEIRVLRGSNLHRAFVYVNKRDIMPVANPGEVMVFEVPQPSHASGQQAAYTTTPAALETPASSLKPSPEPTTTPTVSAATQSAAVRHDTQPVPQRSKLEERLAAINRFEEIKPLVKSLYNEHRVDKNGYGKYATLPANGDCYMFVYNPQGKVVATLKRIDEKIVNLSTMQVDTLDRFSGCGVIWLQIK